MTTPESGAHLTVRSADLVRKLPVATLHFLTACYPNAAFQGVVLE